MSDARLPRVRPRDLFLGKAFLSLLAAVATLGKPEKRERHLNDMRAFVTLAIETPADAYTDDEPTEPVQTTWPYPETRA